MRRRGGSKRMRRRSNDWPPSLAGDPILASNSRDFATAMAVSDWIRRTASSRSDWWSGWLVVGFTVPPLSGLDEGLHRLRVQGAVMREPQPCRHPAVVRFAERAVASLATEALDDNFLNQRQGLS
jgi:hypothetical protein